MSATGYRDVTAGGIRLRVAESGEGSPVIFLHDVFMDHRTWDLMTEDLAEHFRIIAPDLPGFGSSEMLSPKKFSYGFEAFSDCVAGMYAGLGLGRAAIVGHGLGGAIALAVAARHSELVSRLVVIDPACHEIKHDLGRRLAGVPLVGGLLFKQLLGRAGFRSYFRDTLTNNADVSNQRIDRYYETFNSPAARGSTLETLRATADTRPIEADTSRIQAPTLVVWGRFDRLTPAGVGQRLSRQINGAGFELLPSGHSPQEECPRELSRVLANFLRAERASMA